jgi:hypothetical protein
MARSRNPKKPPPPPRRSSDKPTISVPAASMPASSPLDAILEDFARRGIRNVKLGGFGAEAFGDRGQHVDHFERLGEHAAQEHHPAGGSAIRRVGVRGPVGSRLRCRGRLASALHCVPFFSREEKRDAR